MLLLTGCLSTNQGPITTSAPESAGQILDVIDGDTAVIEIDESAVTVRLDGVNAPEGDECGADDAEQWLSSFDGEEVRLEVTGRDQFDRVLAHLHGDGVHVNHELVSLGLALAPPPTMTTPMGQISSPPRTTPTDRGAGSGRQELAARKRSRLRSRSTRRGPRPIRRDPTTRCWAQRWS